MKFKEYFTEQMQGKTSINKEHSHTYKVDDDGNGWTSEDKDHKHEIKKYKVSNVKDHIHTIKK